MPIRLQNCDLPNSLPLREPRRRALIVVSGSSCATWSSRRQ